MSSYDKGYRDGYLEGLSECGPLSGFTKWFERRSKTQKIGKMKEAERQAVMRQAIAEYESEAKGAKARILKNPRSRKRNPTMSQHRSEAEYRIRQAKMYIRDIHKVSDKKLRYDYAIRALIEASKGFRDAAHAQGSRLSLSPLQKQANTIIDAARRVLCAEVNPSEAGSAALGGVAGGLLLGPIGAAAGAYGGVKLKKRAQGKKAARSRARSKSAKRKRNPTVGRLVSQALK